ncbi:MAG TPA: hypothetical protein VFK94_01880 [Patescibacteria group bacterium]|nr:hypothetical protein [Patescibacteria group bacterium]
MELSLILVIITTAAAMILSLVRGREIAFVAFIAGCATALVWATLTGGMSSVNAVFGVCISAAVIWGLLETFVISSLRKKA